MGCPGCAATAATVTATVTVTVTAAATAGVTPGAIAAGATVLAGGRISLVGRALALQSNGCWFDSLD